MMSAPRFSLRMRFGCIAGIHARILRGSFHRSGGRDKGTPPKREGIRKEPFRYGVRFLDAEPQIHYNEVPGTAFRGF